MLRLSSRHTNQAFASMRCSRAPVISGRVARARARPVGPWVESEKFKKTEELIMFAPSVLRDFQRALPPT